MNKIALLFSKAPYGDNFGKEGLDVLLSLSNYTEDLVVIFVDDGVYQITKGQQPNPALYKDSSKLFKLLELYDIESIYISKSAMTDRNLSSTDFVLDAQPLENEQISALLDSCTIKLTF